MNDAAAFYDGLAEFYHLIFQDWDRSMARQGDALASVIERWPGREKFLLDASCGIGTQALALALKDYTVVGSDISIGGLQRGRREARSRGVRVESVAADFRALPFRSGCADVVLACDNAIPHLLSLGEIERAITELRRCGRPGGGVIISMRDYARMPPGTIEARPYGEREWKGRRYAAEQEWVWKGPTYDLTIRFRSLGEGADDSIEFTTTYFAVPIEEVMQVMSSAGLADVERLDGEFYQPLLVGSVP
ncbi:MAG TPA: class I SAM-dependent methyltransferase [Vicinamibacterales bacterium]|nr:class I SAM-dependent methyltransferase [Vicinamibacterales bacterium]